MGAHGRGRTICEPNLQWRWISHSRSNEGAYVQDAGMHASTLLLLKHLLRSRRRCTEQEVGCSSQDRAIIELEFVQCLANPHYLNCGCKWAEGGQANTQSHCTAHQHTLGMFSSGS